MVIDIPWLMSITEYLGLTNLSQTVSNTFQVASESVAEHEVKTYSVVKNIIYEKEREKMCF